MSELLNATWRLPHRLAYVVSHSYPYSSNGYAVRTHEVARALTQQGHDVLVINRPGRPWDISGVSPHLAVPAEQRIDGVRYIFLPVDTKPHAGVRAQIRGAERALFEAFQVFRPGAVMAASNWETAEPAQNAARRWGAPFFYEQRGFWEMSRITWEPEYERSAAYQRERDNEVRIARDAQAVFTLNMAMRKEMIDRGIPAERIHLVPNGVSVPGRIAPDITRQSLGCTTRYLLAYIGTLSVYEGCEDLVQLLTRLRRNGVDVALMIVGSSAPKGMVDTPQVTDQDPDLEMQLRAQAEASGVAEHLHFVPRVPHARIGAYYAMSDAIVMPRRRRAVTELVAPIKPYTAASYGVPVFMTDMAPLDEIAQDIHAKLFPEGDIEAMAEMLGQALKSGAHVTSIKPLDASVFWPQRVQPILRQLELAARMAPSLPTVRSAVSAPAVARPFDTWKLPRVALQTQLDTGVVAAIGPCRHLPRARLTRLTRVNILSELAMGEGGRFVIDWCGLQEDPGEWAGLWSIDNMRLNRQIMEACRVAVDRGWQIQVTGPVRRAKAPLFRTVSALFEEIIPESACAYQEAAQ